MLDIFDTITNMFGELEDDGEDIYEVFRNKPNFDKIKPGQEFEFCGFTFVCLGEEQGGMLCVVSDGIGDCQFNSGDDNNYVGSLIQRKIQNDFISKLDREDADLLSYKMDLSTYDKTASYGSHTDLAGLLTYDLYVKYKDLIPKRSRWWLCTPYSCSVASPYPLTVYSGGYVYSFYAGNSSRCRPACIFAI